jgi:hypothetical protein
MYSFVHCKSRNFLELKMGEALVYIYTNSWFLRQRPGVVPERCYDENIFLEDSDDDGGGILSDMDDNNNNDNGGQGHEGDDGDASNGKKNILENTL